MALLNVHVYDSKHLSTSGYKTFQKCFAMNSAHTDVQHLTKKQILIFSIWRVRKPQVTCKE